MKDLIRPPFANYDVVVYFGGGLFIIPFLNRYIFDPLNLSWPEFNITLHTQIETQIVSILCTLFSIYILGHMIAYAGSQILEKLIDTVFGKISSSIIISVYSRPYQRNEFIRAHIFKQISTIKANKAIFPTIVRLVPHFPVLPLYFIVFIFGIFGYYNSRITPEILCLCKKKILKIGLDDLQISIKSQWFKPLEYCVISRSPAATARMYNYLVIGGLFRSLGTIFLFCTWIQLYFIIHAFIDGDFYLGAAFGSSNPLMIAFEYALSSLAFMFCIFSYIKFQRRYAEEAIFAFAFDKDIVD